MNAAPKQLAFYFMTATSGDYDRLLKRANLVRVQDIVNLALRYYELYAIGKADKDKVLVMVDPKGEEAFALNDDPTDNHQIADPISLTVENSNLETLANALKVDSAPALLTRAFVLLEKVLDAQESGWSIGIYNETENAVDLVDMSFIGVPRQNKTEATISGQGKPYLN
jgi:hypothetical protein